MKMKMMRILGLLLLLPLAAQAQVKLSALTGEYSVTDSTFGAACGTTSSDSAGIQAALNAASMAGGGTVRVPACSGSNYYYLTTAISMPSNVTLKCERGALIRTQAATLTNAVANGNAVFGFFGVSNSGIDGCSIDTYTNSAANPENQYNGIVVTVSNPTDFSGTRSSNIRIENITMSQRAHNVGAGGEYMTWIREADNVKVLNSTYNGNQTTYATNDQQGVEIINGNNVEVAGTTFNNIGRYAVYVAGYTTGTLPNYESTNISIHDNRINVAKRGVVLIPSVDAVGNPAFVQNVIVARNIITDPWENGLYLGIAGVPATLTSMFRNVTLSDNVTTMSVLTQNPFGMSVEFSSATGTADNLLISGNQFIGGKSGGVGLPTGLRMSYVTNAKFIGNSWSGGDTTVANGYIVYITPSPTSEVEFIGNTFRDSYEGMIYVGDGDNYSLVGNTFDNWNVGAATKGVIYVDATANYWSVIGNKFVKYGAGGEYYLQSSPAIANSVAWTWEGNSRDYTPSYNYQAGGLWAGACPTASTAINANLTGCIEVAIAGTSATVSNARVRSGSRIYITQKTGAPVPVKVAPASGSFTLTLGSACATAACDFVYDIHQ